MYVLVHRVYTISPASVKEGKAPKKINEVLDLQAGMNVVQALGPGRTQQPVEIIQVGPAGPQSHWSSGTPWGIPVGWSICGQLD